MTAGDGNEGEGEGEMGPSTRTSSWASSDHSLRQPFGLRTFTKYSCRSCLLTDGAGEHSKGFTQTCILVPPAALASYLFAWLNYK
jgi:hypothetical protein